MLNVDKHLHASWDGLSRFQSVTSRKETLTQEFQKYAQLHYVRC